MVALECDGERYHSGAEKIREGYGASNNTGASGMAVYCLRGSEYYSNPEKAIQRVMDNLNQLGVYPQSRYEAKNHTSETDILHRVKSKCWQIEQEDKKKEKADEKDGDGQISLEL